MKPETAASDIGLSYQKKAPKELRAAFADLPQVPRGCTLTHLMTGTLADRDLVAFQATYIVPAGNVTIPVIHTIYSTNAPAWPLTVVKRRHGLAWLENIFRRLRGNRELLLDDAAFNREMRVFATDEDAAIVLLSPEMQRFMLEKTAVTWRLGRSPKAKEEGGLGGALGGELGGGMGGVGGGRVDMIYSGSLKPDRIAGSLDRLARFWELVPEELLDWVATG